MTHLNRRLQTVIAVLCVVIPLQTNGQATEELEAALIQLPGLRVEIENVLKTIQEKADDPAAQRQLLQQQLQKLPGDLDPQQQKQVVQRNLVLDYMAKFRAHESEIGRVRGAVTFGTTGDTTSTQDQFKATAGVDLTVGTYPDQLRLVTKADIRNNDGDLREDVSTFLVNFDHYFGRERDGGRQKGRGRRNDTRPEGQIIEPCRDDGTDVRRQRETYGFIERFSNSFMSIDRRFEVGGGVKLERHSGALTDAGCSALTTLENLRAQYALVEAAYNELANIEDPNADGAFKKLFPLSTLYNREAFTRNQHSKWEAGIAFSLFRESERPGEITATVLDPDGLPLEDEQENVITKELTPGVSNADRFTIRPSFVWRPRDDFKLTTVYYYKMKLGSDSRVNGVRDVRRDMSLAAEWTVSELKKGRGRPTIVMAIEQHKDSVPPSLAAFIPTELPEGGASFSPLSAEREHRQVRLEVKVNF